ncbi:uncharacterized protein [Montipora capricornis]|uniref:uncharacterized protein n=1 Tax=Montipora capricornis TaxID=246305 RepID=UPI0035F10CCF
MTSFLQEKGDEHISAPIAGKDPADVPEAIGSTEGLQDLPFPTLVLKFIEQRLKFRRERTGKNGFTSENEKAAHKEYTLESYHNQERLPACLVDLNRLEKRLTKFLKEEKPENGDVKLTEDDVVRCLYLVERLSVLSILGLQLDLLDGIENMPPEHYNHRTLYEWIERSVEENIEYLDSVDENALTPQLLASIGFDPSSEAVENLIERSSPASRQQHIEACEWAQIFIADEFKYNPLLSPLPERFPLKSSKTNEWFCLDESEAKEKKHSYGITNVKIMNLETKEWLSKSVQEIKDNDEDEELIFLFHGTDHQSAKNILAVRGIYLNAGRQKRDFSHGKGFYLFNNIDDSLNWANCTTAKPAILIFKANRRFLDSALKLDLFDDKKRWHEIVSAFRSGRRTAKTRKSLRSYDLIKGPMATVRRGESADDNLVVEQKPSSYQICLISSEFAEKFQQTLHSVLFLDNNKL